MTDVTLNISADTASLHDSFNTAITYITNMNADLTATNNLLSGIRRTADQTSQDMSSGFSAANQALSNINQAAGQANHNISTGFTATNNLLSDIRQTANQTNRDMNDGFITVERSINIVNRSARQLAAENRILGVINAQVSSNISHNTRSANNILRDQNVILQDQERELRDINRRIQEQTRLNTRNSTAWKDVLRGAYYQVIPQIVNGIKFLTKGAYEAVAGFEKASVALSAFTGSMESAKAKFWELNALEDRTCQSTDKLANAFVILGKYGLDNSSKALTSYSQIAVAMNKTVEEVANAIGNASQGQFKSLKELGIQAKQEGDQIILTYQGVTTAIGANTGELEKYIQKLSDDNFSGILEEKTKTVEGAMNRMKNAWGTLQTVLFNADTPFGKFFVNGLNEITEFINKAIETIQTPEIQNAFNETCDTLTETAKDLLDGLEKLTDTFLGKECKSWQERWAEICNSVSTAVLSIEFVLQGLIGVIRSVGIALKRFVIDPWSRIGELPDRLDEVRKKVQKEHPLTWWMPQNAAFETGKELGNFFKENFPNFKTAFGEIGDALDESGTKMNQIKDRYAKLQQLRQDIEDGFDGKPVKWRVWENYKPDYESDTAPAPESKPIGNTGTSGHKGGSRSGRVQEARDTWTPYYQQLKELDMKSKSDLEKLEWEHAKKLQEYQKIIAENTKVSEAEKANALLIINTAYQEDRKKIEKEAHDFIRSLDPEEAELMRLEEGYRNKLEQLEQFHEDQLVSEQTFLEKREQLRTQFEEEKREFQKKKDAEKNDFFSKEQLEQVDNFKKGMNSLSDAFENLTQGMNQSSGAYKALFAVQKGFAIASATMNAILAWTEALSKTEGDWYMHLAAYAQAVSLTTGILGQLKSVSMHDKGGKINPGEWGIVGEYGPELIQGPASVTSRRETADLARSAMSGGDVIVNLYESNDKAGSVESEDDNDTRIINIFVSDIRRGGEMSDAIQNTFNLKRIGA